MYILHLSDLYFKDIDDVNTWYNQLAQDLHHQLGCTSLDALILSGNIARESTPESYDAAKQFLNKLCEEFNLECDRIVIVPGNCDLNYEVAEESYSPVRRKQYKGPFLEKGGKPEPDPSYSIDKGEYVEILDLEQYKQRFTHFSNFYEAVKGNPYSLDYEKQYTLDHFPDQNLLILGLNSAWQLDHYYTSRTGICPTSLSNALAQVRRHRDRYENCLKIAVWHHPPTGSAEGCITDKGFLEHLAVAGFRLVFHGHLKKSETSSFQYDMATNGRKLDFVCAGTFGAPINTWAVGHPLQYNFLELNCSTLTVNTRCRKEPSGAWEPHPIRLQGASLSPLPHYRIELSEADTASYPKNAIDTEDIEILLCTWNGASLNEILRKRGIRRMVLKMSAGKISSTNIDLAKDHRASAEKYLVECLTKHGTRKAIERYEHLIMIVRTECQEAHDTVRNEDEVFGMKMLTEVRNRLRELYSNTGSPGLFGCRYEHLLGIAGILTEDCKLWWSVEFEIPEEVGT